ncbi:MAG: EpsI family protein [Planctomycetes bacterium]|nr:EpsI family protein [Planctomycetota bacterium]
MDVLRSKSIPLPIALGGLVLSLSGVFLLLSMARYWGANPDYSDRFLILLACGWLVWRSWPSLDEPRPTWLGLPLVIVGALAAPAAYYLLAQVGPRIILLWWMTASWALAVAGAVLLVGGWSWLRTFAFPIAFLFLALPIPLRIEGPLQNQLQIVTTWLAEHGLRAFGANVRRQGFELHLPSGGLEVVEACSGVRSVTALLAIAAFVAHYRGFGLIRGLVMLGLALPVIAAVNALRIMITGALQEGIGVHAIQGTPHEILGIVMVLIGLGFVLLLSQFLRPNEAAVVPEPEPRAVNWPVYRGFWLASTLLSLGLAVSALAFVAGRERVTQIQQTALIEQIPLQIGEWQGNDVPIPEEIQTTLTCDKAISRIYRNDFGQEIGVWVIFWQASTSIKGHHHPDICLPNRGFRKSHEGSQHLEIEENIAFSATIRHYELDRTKMRVTYWTQEGTHIWTNEDELNADPSGPGHAWIRDRLVSKPPNQTARLTVLISASRWSDRGDQSINLFTQEFAKELYNVCPWARPGTTR